MTFDFLPTICANFQRTVSQHGNEIALRDALDGSTLTWREYDERVRRIAAGLAGLGVDRGDTVGLMLRNRPEFHLVDAAAVHLGATPFSIYNTNPAEAIAYQFGNAGNRVVVCEEEFLPRIRSAMAGTDQVRHVVCVDGHPDGTISLAELENRPAPGFDFEAAWRAVEPDDVLTIIYTSGTTGPPKGVELTHANLVANIRGASEVIDPADRHRVVSYLPDAHIVNRYVCHYAPMMSGSETVTLADPKQIVATLAEVRPTGFVGVPQIWYKVKLAIESGLAAEPITMKRQLGEWAISVGRQKVRLESAGRPIPAALRIQHAAAERLVLSRIRATMGLDQLIVAATGAAPIAADALEFVLGLGLPVCEAWGMSELAAVGTVNRPGRIRIGTVGQAATGIELRIADDGEVLVRGPIVMKGYRNEPEKTAEVIDPDGWLHTGDIGTLDADGYLSIVDRKKELIINAGGKNMSPSNIEGQIRVACPMVGAAIAIGDNRPYVTALLALDPDAAATFAKDHDLPDDSPAALATNPEVRATIEAGIKQANDKLSRVEQIKKFHIVPDTWEPGGDELTPTMKLRRKPIIAKYSTEIDALYTG